MKSLYLFILAVFLVLISSSDSRSQDQTFNLGAINIEYSDTLGGTNNQLFFDIVLQHTNYGFSFPFEYSIGQYFLEFNPNIANGGTLSYKIVDSDIPFIYQPRNPNVLGNLLRLAGNSITNPGYFISSISPGTRIVRMRLTTSASSFAEEPIDLRWKITGTVRTKIGIRNIINIEISDNGTYYTDSLVNYVNLLYPVEKSIVPASSVNFIWNKVNTAARYTLLVSADSNMNSILYNDSLITDTVKNVSGLILGNRFFWRIAVHETSGNTYYSKVKDFYTKHLTVYPPDNSSELPQSITFNWNRPGINISHYLLNI
ncbi:MAG: hypothetical protein IPM96_11815 [Ignavibacteria bacterium]|nr:hypothetical protein [Ignavibacteria bacterium]